MNEQIIKNRIRALCCRLKKKQIDCLIVTKPANVTYLTAFSGDDSWAVIRVPKARASAGALRTCLVTDSRYTEQARKECLRSRIVQCPRSLTETTAKLIAAEKPVQTIAIEDSTSVAVFGKLKKSIKACRSGRLSTDKRLRRSRVRIKQSSNITESLRQTKDSLEVAAISKAAKIAQQALTKALAKIRPRITENELAGILDFQIRRLGAQNSFETIVAFGSNASRPHHRPGTKKLKKNDTILIDFGAKFKNYCCDLTRCFVIGRPTALYKKVFGVLQQAQAAAINAVAAGAEIRKVDNAARTVIANANLPVYGHGTGHGIGLEVHEAPVVSKHRKGRLQPGHVITIEPAVYIPGKLGLRIEDDILVTETGYKLLTSDRFRRSLPVIKSK